MSCSSQCSTTGVTKAVVCAIVSGMVHIKEPLLLIRNSPGGGSGFPLSLSEWFFIICPMPCNRKQNISFLRSLLNNALLNIIYPATFGKVAVHV